MRARRAFCLRQLAENRRLRVQAGEAPQWFYILTAKVLKSEKDT
jgi:hypothetical protein